MFILLNLTFDFSSSSNPGENSCGASGIFGIGAPLGIPSKVSTWPSLNGDSPLNIRDKPDCSLVIVHCWLCKFRSSNSYSSY